MPLPHDFHRPFDETYRRVTARVNAYAARDNDERRWLDGLIDGFQAERNVWATTPELSPYFTQCERLKDRLLHLAVCAYLHVSYDLPRVIADRWPGSPAWPGPSTTQGQWVFFDLASTFPEALLEISRLSTVLGYPSWIARFAPPTIMEALSHWVLHLRTAAWIHARLLHEDPNNRPFRERRMREAMTAALDRVCSRKLWSGALLHPPNPPTPGIPAVFGLTAAKLDHAWVGAAGVVVLSGMLASYGMLARRRRAELRSFVNELGLWTYRYVTKAIADPKRGFDEDGNESSSYEPSLA